MTALVPASMSKMSGYRDDTYGALQTARRIVNLRGQQPLERLKFTPPAGVSSSALDARRAIFTVANSRNPKPTADQDCDQGNLPVNKYPLLIEQQDRTAIIGGLFLSRVPQSSEWRATYCNSSVITFEGVSNGVVDGVRITGAWDAIRVGRGSPGLLIENSWISNARDDAVENDFLQTMTIRDTLIDGAFQGISVKPRKDSNTGDASNQMVTLSGVLLRLQEYSYKEGRRFGALTKSDQRAPRFQVVNSVVAVDYAGGTSYPQFWTTSWSKLTGSSNNLFLWLSDAPIPDFVPLPPSSFRLLRGQAARDAWTRAKNNWINCHPKLTRLPTEPRSNPDTCVPNSWGGFTN
ncbi:hypothetical protein VVT58_18105 (plasmid) [Sphingobium sp. SJ10-10]|uniref:hypothetical protein n=1 Tax=Sphingobium sp. SJ10-10 TaxID=3114999 RepID=UPI002E16DC96|nr:hypothetical protein [Sphingobium sp. SJ10-10]